APAEMQLLFGERRSTERHELIIVPIHSELPQMSFRPLPPWFVQLHPDERQHGHCIRSGQSQFESQRLLIAVLIPSEASSPEKDWRGPVDARCVRELLLHPQVLSRVDCTRNRFDPNVSFSRA